LDSRLKKKWSLGRQNSQMASKEVQVTLASRNVVPRLSLVPTHHEDSG
jgi:hypothetical protein